jgi:CRP-like cAMP-binding protein
LSLFSGLSCQDLDLLVRSAVIRSYPPEACIIRQGDDDTNLFVILSGRVKVMRGEKELALLESGDFFGEMALLTGASRSADIYSLDKVTCLMIDREAFRILLEMNSAIYENINKLFAERSKQAQSRESGRKKTSAESLLAKFKSIFCQPGGL